MSLAALILQIIFAFLGFVASIQGLFALLSGLLMFVALPIIPRLAGEFQRLANLHLYFATGLLQRIAIVVSEHGDIYLKRMQFDDLGVEKIQMGDEAKEFEDPDAALHYWFDMPFALANEKHGVLFDPRHAALGARKKAAEEQGEQSIHATQEEWDTYGVHEWKRGAYAFATGVYELVDLTNVKHIIDGGERGEYPARVENLYRYSRVPLKDGRSATPYIMVLVALLAPFFGIWLLASQLGSGGGGGTGGSTISFSALLLLVSAGSLKTTLQNLDWRFIGKLLSVALPLPVVFLLLFVFVSPLLAIFAFLTIGIGFWLLPALGILSRVSTFLSGGLAKVFMKLGLIGYDRPVFVWTPESYRLREYDDLHDVDEANITWYGLAGALIGFTFVPEPESWGTAAIDKKQFEQRAVTDGGATPRTEVPSRFRRVPSQTRASTFAGFIPKQLKRGYYYVNSGIAMGWFSDSANGEKSLARLLKSKEEYGEDTGMDDGTLIKAMVGCGMLSFLMGIGVFFVL